MKTIVSLNIKDEHEDEKTYYEVEQSEEQKQKILKIINDELL